MGRLRKNRVRLARTEICEVIRIRIDRNRTNSSYTNGREVPVRVREICDLRTPISAECRAAVRISPPASGSATVKLKFDVPPKADSRWCANPLPPVPHGEIGRTS
jgi:hypothetical protein